jgi:hypothetical protein
VYTKLVGASLLAKGLAFNIDVVCHDDFASRLAPTFDLRAV